MKRSLLRFIGLVLVLSSLPKIMDTHRFLLALRGYRIFPEFWLPGLVHFAPALELVVGAALIVRCSRAAHWWATLLFGLFSGLLLWSRFQGLGLNCGCFGRWESWLHRQPFGLDIHILGVSLLFAGLVLALRKP
ncbi:MAG: hypothetical protein KF760_18680 [Candidatus Eremiobacteraeota bacterium]|nr:hypothetical protein [Candidatus Eremiobacteraeota bacterium]MCW5872421.1 hypothetical protein [Candidatus Eremiobacteraeota bacterium]